MKATVPPLQRRNVIESRIDLATGEDAKRPSFREARSAWRLLRYTANGIRKSHTVAMNAEAKSTSRLSTTSRPPVADRLIGKHKAIARLVKSRLILWGRRHVLLTVDAGRPQGSRSGCRNLRWRPDLTSSAWWRSASR
jgi:hypothetical protein